MQNVNKGVYFVLLIRLHVVPGLGVVLAIPPENKTVSKLFNMTSEILLKTHIKELTKSLRKHYVCSCVIY